MESDPYLNAEFRQVLWPSSALISRETGRRELPCENDAPYRDLPSSAFRSEMSFIAWSPGSASPSLESFISDKGELPECSHDIARVGCRRFVTAKLLLQWLR